jgi:alkylmercury lyase
MEMKALPLQSAVAATIRSSQSFVDEERAIIRAAYPLLARGHPVFVEELSAYAGVALGSVTRTLERHPGLAHLDLAGRIEGFLGLSLKPTSHRLEIGGRSLYAWCAWDALFIPRLVGVNARVTSTCPISGVEIALTATPDGIQDVRPDATAMSFSSSGCEDDPGGVIGAACHEIHFLASREAAERWIDTHPHAQTLALREAWQLAWLFVMVCLGGIHSPEAEQAAS